MELRIDRLLADLADRTAEILGAIDADPLLLKRQSGDLVLANASQLLYTPQAQHQLYAKGIVYQREPYRLVSLPLIKIYNIGERGVTLAQLAELLGEPGVQLRFLRKFDGSLIQAFGHQGRAWFTTRGMIEGARWRFEGFPAGGAPEQDEDRRPDFDFLAEARAVARGRYPAVLDDPGLLAGRTLVFEFIHPGARKVTSYGDRADLVLLACFDHGRFAYLPHDELQALGTAHGLTVVDALAPCGPGLAEQVDDLLGSLAGTDQEGSVLCFERPGSVQTSVKGAGSGMPRACPGEPHVGVIYRVKVKSPEYLQLMRILAFCTYERTVQLLDANPGVRTWEGLRALLQEQGRQRVPEEVLGFYRQHLERFLAYLADLQRLRNWAEETCRRIDAQIGGRGEGPVPTAYRRAFAAQAVQSPQSALLFAALDGRLNEARLRALVRSPDEARAILNAESGMGNAE
jgi:hypothetical protein